MRSTAEVCAQQKLPKKFFGGQTSWLVPCLNSETA